jgi:hypothetical protein
MADKTPVSISLTSHQKRLLSSLATAETNGNKSAWIVMAIEAAIPRIERKAKNEHSASAEHRSLRTDGKCNPKLVEGPCPVCYKEGV